MSVPANLKSGPFTTITLIKKKYLIFYIFLIWVSLFTIQLEFWWYWNFLYDWKYIHFLVFLPLLIILMYITSVLVSLIFAKILLVFVNLIHKPKEGVFLRYPSDKDYRYWSIRSVIKKWPIWLAHKFPFPFLDNLCLKMFGVKTKFSNSLFEGWVDTEFIKFGKNVVVGQGSIIQSAVIVGNLFILRKTIIEDNVRIGAHSVVMPGVHIEKNCILAGASAAMVGQQLEEGWIYIGAPAKKYKKNLFFEDGLEEVIEKQIEVVEDVREKYEELYLKRHDKSLN